MIEDHFHVSKSGVVHMASIYWDDITMCGRRARVWGCWPVAHPNGRPCLSCAKAKAANSAYEARHALKGDGS